MPLELIDDAAGDPRNAAFLAHAADLAYLPAAEGAEAFRSQLGLEATLIAVGNTQVYVAQNDRAIVTAFRGSEAPSSIDGFKDWLLTNASNFLVLPEGRIGTDFVAAGVGARFHRGFLEALAAIWDPLFAAVSAAMDQKERPLWVTGHSLGGALALLAAWRFQRQFIPVHQVYTFGAPMVGNAVAAEAFAREFPGKIFRFIDDRDLVPWLPTMSLVANEYVHCLAEIPLHLAEAAGDALGSASASLKDLAGNTPDGRLSLPLIDSLWGSLQQRIQCHLMSNYLARITDKLGESG